MPGIRTRASAKRFGIGPLAVSPELLAQLATYPWPGNVRELENALESAVALSPDGTLDLSLLPSIHEAGATEPRAQAGLKERVAGYERGLIVAALDGAKGNRSEAARSLDIGRATLHDKLRKYGLATEQDEES